MIKEIDNNQKTEHDLLFTIDDGNYSFLVQIWFCLAAIIFTSSLFFIVANSEIENGVTHSYGEFFMSQLTNRRFLGANIMIVIIGFALYIEYKKSKKKNNNIYFYENSLIYGDVLIKKENIKAIKIGCCFLPKGNLLTYFFVFVLMGIIFIPYTIIEILMIMFIEIKKNGKITNLSYKFVIQHNSDNHGLIVGYCLDKTSKQKLIEFKNKIKNGER